MIAKKFCSILCMGVICLMMLSCSRTVEIDEVNIRSYFSGFPAEAQDVIAQGEFVVKTVSGMPSHSVLVGVSPYDYPVKEHIITFGFINSIEGFASGRMSIEAQVPSLLNGYNYSIEEFESQFGVKIDDWSSYYMTYAQFYASDNMSLNGLILTSSEDNMVVYMLFIDYNAKENDGQGLDE